MNNAWHSAILFDDREFAGPHCLGRPRWGVVPYME